MKRSQVSARGFTLVELLVAFAVFAVLMISVLQLLDSSTQISKTESNLSDVQESVRFSTYHLLRIARMAGVGAGTDDTASTSDQPPAIGSYLNNGTSVVKLAADVLNNTTNFTDRLGNNHNTLANQDVLLLRGYFDSDLYFADVVGSSIVSSIKIEAITGGGVSQVLRLPSLNQGVLLEGQGRFAVATVAAGSAIAAGEMTVNLDTSGGGGIAGEWLGLNPNGTFVPPPHVYKVAFLDTYMFFVGTDNILYRWRMSSSGDSAGEPVATDIGGFQVALGLDIDHDGGLDEWIFDTAGETLPSDALLPGYSVVALRMTVFGQSRNPVVGWTEPNATFSVEDMVAPTGAAAESKWRVMQVVATLRNYSL